jgi:hypothetical protein
MSNQKIVPDSCNFCTSIAALGNHFALDKRQRIAEAHPTDHDKIIIKGSNIFVLQIGSKWFFLDTDVNLSTTNDIDTGSVSNGKQYYVYACDNSGVLTFKISLNSTYPSGYTASNSRKIAGFHTLCANVGTIGGHTLTGYLANDILPASIWDLKHRPVCEPSGMVYDEAINKWADIYLASSTGATCASVYGATIQDTRNWMDFVDDGHTVKKRLLHDEEFQSAMAGSNEETNITGSADPVTTGGHVDTAGRRMISDIGCEDGAGVMHQWLLDQSWRLDGADLAACKTWAYQDLAGSKGSLYKEGTHGDVKLLAGLYWDHATDCGSRGRNANNYRWNTHSYIGARFLAESL